MEILIDMYCLIDPLTGETRYIGKAKNAQARFKGHMRDSKRRKTPLYSWIESLTKQGLHPIMEVILHVPESEWQRTERFMIAKGRELGMRLLNIAEGGDQPFCPTSIRAANGRKNAKAIHSDPKRKKQWHLKQMLACNLRFLKKNGMIESYNRITSDLARKGIYLKA